MYRSVTAIGSPKFPLLPKVNSDFINKVRIPPFYIMLYHVISIYFIIVDVCIIYIYIYTWISHHYNCIYIYPMMYFIYIYIYISHDTYIIIYIYIYIFSRIVYWCYPLVIKPSCLHWRTQSWWSHLWRRWKRREPVTLQRMCFTIGKWRF